MKFLSSNHNGSMVQALPVACLSSCVAGEAFLPFQLGLLASSRGYGRGKERRIGGWRAEGRGQRAEEGRGLLLFYVMGSHRFSLVSIQTTGVRFMLELTPRSILARSTSSLPFLELTY